MAEPKSPVVPNDLSALSTGMLACDRLKLLAETRDEFRDFLKWFLQDNPTGLLGEGFLLALSQQFLFDATKKGYIVGTDSATGYISLFKYLALAKLDPDGAVDGDTIVFNATDGIWEIQSSPSIYLAPTSGGATVPAVNTGGKLSVAHGFAATPRTVSAWLECNSTDAGFAVGDKVSAHDLIFHNVSVPENLQAITTFANASVVGVTFRDGAGGDAYRLNNNASFAVADISPSKWDVKLYASLK